MAPIIALLYESSTQFCLQHTYSSSGEGIFLLLVRLLFGSQEASSPGLAADFLQALLTGDNGCVRQLEDMRSSSDWMALAAQLSSVTPGQILELISTTSQVKVAIQSQPPNMASCDNGLDCNHMPSPIAL